MYRYNFAWLVGVGFGFVLTGILGCALVLVHGDNIIRVFICNHTKSGYNKISQTKHISTFTKPLKMGKEENWFQNFRSITTSFALESWLKYTTYFGKCQYITVKTKPGISVWSSECKRSLLAIWQTFLSAFLRLSNVVDLLKRENVITKAIPLLFFVYFDQQTGAPHTFWWSKSSFLSFSMFSIFFCHKREKIRESTKIRRQACIKKDDSRKYYHDQ